MKEYGKNAKAIVASAAVLLGLAFCTDAMANDVIIPEIVERVEHVETKWDSVHNWIDVNDAPFWGTAFNDEEYEDATCMALNIYHEARSSTFGDMSATAHVVLNRVESHKFPDDICEVVWQKAQFSWTGDGKSDKPYEKEAWYISQFVAFSVMEGHLVDKTGGADHYHTSKVKPAWTHYGYDKRVIGAHVYMKVKPKIVPKVVKVAEAK